VSAKPCHPDRWEAKAKLAAVVQTAAMNEIERSTYCPEHGQYVERLDN
jgi:transposase